MTEEAAHEHRYHDEILNVDTVAAKAEFDTLFVEAINPKTSTGRLIYGFIRRWLRCYQLGYMYTEDYVLNDVYFRGQKFVTSGGTIKNLTAWIKGTAYRVIQELSRDGNKTSSLDDLNLDVRQPEQEVLHWAELFAALRVAFSYLSPVEQRLLTLKEVEGLPWAEIRQIMRKEGYGDDSEATWRKRKERALSRLRKAYHQIHPSL
jgi:DNA-directed RNA polymerase specialized sigma24 family protein